MIILVGLPGSGKSTIGRQLAKRLHLPFVDSDQVLEQSSGCSIKDYFDRFGEAGFRDLEEQTIAEIVERDSDAIVSTGGGVVLRKSNRDALRRHGKVIYLKSSPDDLYRRLKYDASRPLLQVADPLARLRELYEARDPLYRETAHFILETGRPSVATLVNMIAMQLELSSDDIHCVRAKP